MPQAAELAVRLVELVVRTSQAILTIALPSLLACSPSPVSYRQLVGRWEFLGGANLDGVTRPAGNMHMTLVVTRLERDSIFGKAVVTFSSPPPKDIPCALMKGVREGGDEVGLVVFTTDAPNLDIMIDGRIRGDSMIATSIRPRNGGSVVPTGAWISFGRTSIDTVASCLTTAPGRRGE